MALPRKYAIAVTVIVLAIIVISGLIVLVTLDRNRNVPEEESYTPGSEVVYKPDQTIISDYVNKRDEAYAFTVLHELTLRDNVEKFTSYILNMTSQRWLTDNDSDRSLWWHYIIVTVPDVIRYNGTGLLFISSGSDTDRLPDPDTDAESRVVSYMATKIGLVSAVLRSVPNQPITFKKDVNRQKRSGSDLLAYTLREVIQGHSRDYNWLLLCPMVKAIVRGLDTLSNFTDGAVTRFYLSGASERGWATWLTAAVDDRVIGIAPLVFGNLNFIKNIKHHQRTLNGYSWAMAGFWNQKITHYLEDNVADYVFHILDPLTYNNQLKLAKYIILASNDEQYIPDSTRLFYNELVGPTFLRIYPNTENSLRGSWHKMASDCIGFILTVEEKWILPDVRWDITESNQNATINLRTSIAPSSIKVWSALTRSPIRRDFRLRVATSENSTDTVHQQIIFRENYYENVGPKHFRAAITKPTTGWIGIFLEVVFESPHGTYFTVTSELSIVPDSYAVEECIGDRCVGSLV